MPTSVGDSYLFRLGTHAALSGPILIGIQTFDLGGIALANFPLTVAHYFPVPGALPGDTVIANYPASTVPGSFLAGVRAVVDSVEVTFLYGQSSAYVISPGQAMLQLTVLRYPGS